MKAESDSESADEIDIKVEMAEMKQKIRTADARLKAKDLEYKV